MLRWLRQPACRRVPTWPLEDKEVSNTLSNVAPHMTAHQRVERFLSPSSVETEPFDVLNGVPVPDHTEKVVPSSQEQAKVFGLIGATVAGKAGAVAAPIATLAAGGGWLALPAWIGGRVAGATIGGTIGVLVGKALGAVGVHVPMAKWLVDQADRFSLKELPRLAANPQHYSHAKLGDTDVQKLESVLQPGDILISARERLIGSAFKVVLKGLAGDSGTWIHAAIYGGRTPRPDGQVPEQPLVYEMHSSTSGPRSLEEYAKRNCQVMVLRPHYNDPEHVDKVVGWMAQRDGMKYDFSFNLERRDKMYCLVMPYDAFKDEAPEIRIGTRTVMGKEGLTPGCFIESPDVTPLYSTGGHFWETFLGQFVPSAPGTEKQHLDLGKLLHREKKD